MFKLFKKQSNKQSLEEQDLLKRLSLSMLTNEARELGIEEKANELLSSGKPKDVLLILFKIELKRAKALKEQSELLRDLKFYINAYFKENERFKKLEPFKDHINIDYFIELLNAKDDEVLRISELSNKFSERSYQYTFEIDKTCSEAQEMIISVKDAIQYKRDTLTRLMNETRSNMPQLFSEIMDSALIS